MMMDRPNRTFISSVLFLDIVGYSKLPVTEQIRLKQQFNDLVSHLISDIPENDRIVLDTGDGAALSFLGDPEDALFVAVKLRDAITEKQETEFPDLHLRMGINLGPVKLLKDINGRPNLIGDGINVAQRVMNFAEPDKILVSRSFYDVVSCLSDEYRDLFRHQGIQTDKHVREHELYEIGFVDPDRSVTINQRMQLLETSARLPQDQVDILEKALQPHVGDHAHVLVQARAMGARDFESLREALASYISDPEARAEFLKIEPVEAPKKRAREHKPWLIPAVFGGILAAVLIAWVLLQPSVPTSTEVVAAGKPAGADNKQDTPPAPAAAPAQAPAATPVPAAADSTTSATPALASSQSLSVTPASEPPVPAKEEPKKTEPKKAEKKPAKDAPKDAKNTKAAPPVTPPSAPAAATPAPPPRDSNPGAAARARNATIRFQISGGGEVYIDGAAVGNSSSVNRVPVTPGEHRIEVRNCGFPPDTKRQTVSVDANDSRMVVIGC